MNNNAKAFIFDMDGVVVDSERYWPHHLAELMPTFLEPEVAEYVWDKTTGMSLDLSYQFVRDHGSQISFETYAEGFHRIADRVYEESNITHGLAELVECLLEKDFKIGLVSASPYRWINQVKPKLPHLDQFQAIISCQDEAAVQPKPAPDGYLLAMKQLGATPEQSIIVEDSNAGVTAAKSSGALAICLKEHHLPEHFPPDADLYAQTMQDLRRLVQLMK